MLADECEVLLIEQQLELPLGVGGLELLTPRFGQLVAEAGVLAFQVAVVDGAGEEVADRAQGAVGGVLHRGEGVLDPVADLPVHPCRPRGYPG